MEKKLNGASMSSKSSSQSRLESFIEANVNTFAGFFISWATAYLVLPLFGMQKSITDSLEITTIFTSISIARNYFIRRMFNAAK